LDGFVGNAEQCLKAQAAERDDGRRQLVEAAQRMRDDLARIERRRELALADYERALEDKDPKARIVLEVVGKLDGERDDLAAKIADTEAVAAEWHDTDDSGLADSVDLLRHADPASLDATRVVLSDTGPQTFVYRCLTASSSRPASIATAAALRVNGAPREAFHVSSPNRGSG
jgi:hypothetical protein